MIKRKIKLAIADDHLLFRQGLIALLSDYEEFKIQHDKIGYREIKLTDQSMVTNVNYL